MSVAAVDIGTNSVRSLIVDAEGRELARPMRMTRLGQGVDTTGELAAEAIARTIDVLREYRALMDRHGVERVRATATSAARDARNREHFLAAAEAALGARPELLSGDEEAKLSFTGATHGLPAAAGPFLILDIGGGSTELAFGSSEPERFVSLQLGCVRMTERHLRSDPPATPELAACLADVREQLSTARRVLAGTEPRQVVGLAGTVTAISGLQLGLTVYDARRTHHSRLTRAHIEHWFAVLSRASVAERRAMLAEPARASVIVGGAAVLLGAVQELALDELLVSEHDILDGLAASLLRG